MSIDAGVPDLENEAKESDKEEKKLKLKINLNQITEK